MRELDYLVGVGGVGMSALAQTLFDSGRWIAGCDRACERGETPAAVKILKSQGMALFKENSAMPDGSVSRVVVSSAIEADHPALVNAKRYSIPVIHRAVALAEALEGRKLLAVAGTCGKSTVTAMLGHLLSVCGLDPQVVNGASVPGWDVGGTRVGSVLRGRGEYAVAEVDESDKSLTAFSPYAAIITNSSADHFMQEETDSIFDDFRSKVKCFTIDARDCSSPQFPETKGFSGSFVFEGVRFEVPMPGLHNVFNAWNAVRMAFKLGLEPEKLMTAMKSFPGVERRMQFVGFCNGARVIDDYAHNTEKLRALVCTLKEAFPEGFSLLWRPHGYAPLRKMKDSLAGMFAGELRKCDKLFLLPVYDAGGTADRSVNTKDLAGVLRGAMAASLVEVEDIAAAHDALLESSRSVQAIAVAGARDPQLSVLASSLCKKQ